MNSVERFLESPKDYITGEINAYRSSGYWLEELELMYDEAHAAIVREFVSMGVKITPMKPLPALYVSKTPENNTYPPYVRVLAECVDDVVRRLK